MQETATLAEVLAASRLIHQQQVSGQPLDPALFPPLQRLGIAGASDASVSLDKHAEQVGSIRKILMK